MREHDRETLELKLSNLMDLELERDELLPTIDHLVDQSDLREFWREGRALDAMALAQVADRSTETGDTESLRRVWSMLDRQQDDAQAASRSRAQRRAMWSWAAAAAVILAALGGWWVGNFPPAAETSGTQLAAAPAEGSDDYIEVVVGAGSLEGGMTDERFVELTAELLRADPRYHRKMDEILDLVNSRQEASEGSRERSLGLETGDRGSRAILEAADTRAGDARRRQL